MVINSNIFITVCVWFCSLWNFKRLSVCILKIYVFDMQIGDKALISVAENCKSLRELTLQFCER
jgi:hypothetical protein